MLHYSSIICGDCGYSASDKHEMHLHVLTAHAAKYDTDMDSMNPGAPALFNFHPKFGPELGDFTAYNQMVIAQRLMICKRFPRRGGIPRIPPPPQPTSGFYGDFRGIPGINNSCFLDVFFMIIAYSSAFDRIFTQEALNASVLLQIILYDLVIPLRTRMSVSRDVIAMIRQLMFEETRRTDYLNDIFDMEELMMHIYDLVPSFSSICNLVNSSNSSGSIVCPMVLALVSPENGVHVSLQSAILYSLYSKETTILSPPPDIFFVRVRPGTSDVPPLALPQTEVSLATGTYLNDRQHVVEILEKSSYSLSKVICIIDSHYTGFLKIGDKWFYFDSMHGFDKGHCVPTITYVPGFEEYLNSGCRRSEYLLAKSDARPNETRIDYTNIVTKGSYAYVFSKKELSEESLYRGGCAATASKPTSVRLPDIDESLLTGLSLVHHDPPSFGHTQPHCMSSLITSPEHFYDECKHAISRNFFPEQITVYTHFNYEYCVRFIQNLFSSIVFDEHDVSYRIISFTMEDRTSVSYHGNIDNLSKKHEKQSFYAQLEPKISRQDVISVVIAKIH